MFNQEIKLPKDRIAVLIGKKGEVRKHIEKRFNAKIRIDSKSGDVLVSGEDSFDLYIVGQVINAIARGFNPEIAETLSNEENIFEYIDISTFAKGNKSKLFRLRSRVIGTEGRARKLIEQLTNTNIVVYGKTVGIIGKTENVLNAKRAIENLLRGSKHGNVYAMLERERKNDI